MPAPSQNNFAAAIDSRASEPQDYVCFLDAQNRDTVTYFELRLRAAHLAREIEAQGILRGGVCALDAGNSEAALYAVAAAAFGGFTIVMLNVHLTEAEKLDRIDEIKKAYGIDYLPILDEPTALSLAHDADSLDAAARNRVVQWARHGVASFDDYAPAFVMFTSGTRGRSKAVEVTWEALVRAAHASNKRLNTSGEGIWQLVLPLSHVDGLQVFIRSVLNRNAFLLYRTFDARAVLADAKTYGVTHIAVVDKMLQDLLATDAAAAQGEDEGAHEDTTESPAAENSAAAQDKRAESNASTPTTDDPATDELAALEDYECVLLGGTQPNKATLIRALGLRAPLYASYGLTETCSQAANAKIQDTERILLEPLEGYEFTVAAPDELGYGQLGVRGISVVSGYLNAQAVTTADGFFLTGDRARIEDGHIELAETANAVFSSGGENIYPGEIRDKILGIEGVTDAYVFGAADTTLGRRAVAFVEASAAASRPGYNAYYFADDMRNRLSTRLGPLHLPAHFVVMDEFPRTGLGKVGEGTLERAWDARIQIAKVELWHVRLPLLASIRTAKTRLRSRETAIVRVTDYAGRTGLGECPSFPNDWLTTETLSKDLPFIRNFLGPLLVGRVLLHPSDTISLFENAPGAPEHPLACAALEAACWDLYGKIRDRSIRHLLGVRDEAYESGVLGAVPAGCVLGGASVGLGTVPEVLASIAEAVDAGFRRVKLKVRPGEDVDTLRAVRREYPDLMLMLDADQSYRDDQIDILQELDEYDIACIEEPLDPHFTPTVGPTDIFDRLARLQAKLRMRVCLDESWTDAEQLQAALEGHPELRCVALKVGKFGSVARALEFHAWARERGIEAWPGGLYETGVSKRLHAAFGLLPGANTPGDLSDSTRYFTVDICDPAFAFTDGVMQVNPPGHETGLGCVLNEPVLANVTERYWVCE